MGDRARFYQVILEDMQQGDMYRVAFQDPRDLQDTIMEFTIGEPFFFNCPWFDIGEVVAEHYDGGMVFTSTDVDGEDNVAFWFLNMEEQQLKISYEQDGVGYWEIWTYFFVMVD